MTANGIITLLTDFGWQDVYVGVMKGAIAAINSQLQAIDLTHEIPPQNIAAARFCLLNAYPYFPSGTVHIAVVDPGVGSQRRGVAIQFADGFLVGPDNGLFSGVLSSSPALAAVELTNINYWRTPNPSTTFHGRDIFAPVGAHLASGVSLEQLGNSINPDSLEKLTLPELTITDNKIIGCIQYSDRFGNLITNIPANKVNNRSWSMSIKNKIIPTVQTYSDVPQGEIATLIGSHGWVEIAVNGGSAREKLQLDDGDKVEINLN
jgi:S-adenosylmethionine hydrolase